MCILGHASLCDRNKAVWKHFNKLAYGALLFPSRLHCQKCCEQGKVAVWCFLQISQHLIVLQMGDKDCTAGGTKVSKVHCTGTQKSVDDTIKAEIHKLVHSRHMQRTFKQESTP